MSDTPTAPILISASARRSGTTLVQRLLSSASNALIYGEDAASDLQLLSTLWQTKKTAMELSKHWRAQQLESVLGGNVNDWIPNLMPGVDGYLETYQQAIFKIVDYYASFAAQHDRPLWGAKLPDWSPASLLLLQKMMPGTKVIYIFRDLADCVQSAKAAGMIQHQADLQTFCETWQRLSLEAQQYLKGEDVLILYFHELIANGDEHIHLLEQFTGAKNIQSSVLSYRINNYTSGGGIQDYIAPKPLTPKEQQMIRRYQPNLFSYVHQES